jgi:hypothetical protein
VHKNNCTQVLLFWIVKGQNLTEVYIYKKKMQLSFEWEVALQETLKVLTAKTYVEGF